MAKRYVPNKKDVYSVDLMFSYVNNFNCKVVKIPIEKLLFNLDVKGWYEEGMGEMAPIEVIQAPKKFKNQFKKIMAADLRYPIMLDGLEVVDGAHRLSKAVLEGRTHIEAYQFPKDLMKKFKIPGQNVNKINEMKPFEFIDLFVKRFY